MVIPDMLRNAPMFKRLDAKIKVYGFPKVSTIFFQIDEIVLIHYSMCCCVGKGIFSWSWPWPCCWHAFPGNYYMCY